MSESQEEMHDLIAKLDTLSIDGPSRGGPHQGILPNKVTREIVAQGQKIVPLLLEALKASLPEKTIYIIFCLRQLKAKEAKAKILELKESAPFGDTPRDMTLDMQITYFLRDVDNW